MINSKHVEFLGNSLDNLRAFPLVARREAGHQLDQVQNGQEPDGWKPMNTVGQGVKEIRIQDAAGAFSYLYPSYPKILSCERSCERSCGRIAAIQSLDGVTKTSAQPTARPKYGVARYSESSFTFE